MSRSNTCRLLILAHQRRAAKLECRVYHLSWVLTEDAVCSKTTKGYLTTKRLGSRLYQHKLNSYDRV